MDLLAHYLKSDNVDATKAELFQMCAENIELTNKNSDKFIDELTQKIEELEGG
jgi:nucleoid DNA-binding protein